MSQIKPQIFSGRRKPEKAFLEYEKITDFKNISEGMILHFHKAKINSPKEFIKLGWEKTWDKLIQTNYTCSKPFFGHSLFAALENIHRLEITAEQKLRIGVVGQKLRDKYKK